MLTRFLTKGTISGVLAALAFMASMSGHSVLAEVFRNPATADNILQLVAAGLALYAGFSPGPQAAPSQESEAPAHEDDPYPGYDYDPLRGWVRNDS